MKYYYYYILLKIHLKKGARKMKKFWKMFLMGFFIGFGVVCWVHATITNSLDNLAIYEENFND